MLGDEGILDNDILAPCSCETSHIPVVVNAIVCARQEEGAKIRGLLFVNGDGSDDRPEVDP